MSDTVELAETLAEAAAPKASGGKKSPRRSRQTPLARLTNGLLLLPEVPFKIHSRAHASTVYITTLCNALINESRDLRARLATQSDEHEAALAATRNEFLERAKSAEKITDAYRAANIVRRQLQNALHPDGVTHEVERRINNGYHFSYIIGDLAFVHEVFPYHSALHVASQPDAPVKLKSIKLDLDIKSGRLTPMAYIFLQQLRHHVQPEAYATNKTFMDGEVFDGIYDEAATGTISLEPSPGDSSPILQWLVGGSGTQDLAALTRAIGVSLPALANGAATEPPREATTE